MKWSREWNEIEWNEIEWNGFSKNKAVSLLEMQECNGSMRDGNSGIVHIHLEEIGTNSHKENVSIDSLYY